MRHQLQLKVQFRRQRIHRNRHRLLFKIRLYLQLLLELQLLPQLWLLLQPRPRYQPQLNLRLHLSFLLPSLFPLLRLILIHLKLWSLRAALKLHLGQHLQLIRVKYVRPRQHSLLYLTQVRLHFLNLERLWLY